MLKTNSDLRLAAAYTVAQREGILDSHFVILDFAHLRQLLEENALGIKDRKFVKKSTGRPVWIFSVETGQESADKMLSSVLELAGE